MSILARREQSLSSLLLLALTSDAANTLIGDFIEV
jgi:hypothetical protein